MAEAIAIISVVSGAAVAIIVPFISARLERSRLQQQSRDARLDELRAIFDDALKHLWEAAGMLFDVNQEAGKKCRGLRRQTSVSAISGNK